MRYDLLNLARPVEEAKTKKSSLNEAYEAWQSDKTTENLNKLFEQTKPVIQAGLRTYTGQNKDPVLELEAKKLVRHAYETYDKAKGANLRTYLLRSLEPLKRKKFHRTTSLKIPQKAWYDLNNIRTARHSFEADNDRQPTLAELAEATGLSQKRIQYLSSFERSVLPEAVLQGPEGGEYRAPGEVSTAQEDFWAEAVYQSLGPQDQLIYDYRLGAHDKKKLSNREIARKLGISASAVSQRVNKIIALLEQGL